MVQTLILNCDHSNENFKCKEDHHIGDATYAAAKIKPEKIQDGTGLEPWTSVIPMQRSNQLN